MRIVTDLYNHVKDNQLYMRVSRLGEVWVFEDDNNYRVRVTRRLGDGLLRTWASKYCKTVDEALQSVLELINKSVK